MSGWRDAWVTGCILDASWTRLGENVEKMITATRTEVVDMHVSSKFFILSDKDFEKNKNPEFFRFPGFFPEISRKFPGIFQEIFRQIPGNFPVISQSYPGNFPEMSNGMDFFEFV